MTRRVLFTAAAERQIDSLYEYIADRAGEGRADVYVGRIIDFCRRLDEFPMRGQRRDDLLPGLRIVGFERRVTVAFLVSTDAVVIEGVFYGGRNLESIFAAKRES